MAYTSTSITLSVSKAMSPILTDYLLPAKIPYKMCGKAPVCISYQPKQNDYLPVVVAAIRRHLGDWPIVIISERQHRPPSEWLLHNLVETLVDWEHSPGANKVLRFWEHQAILAEKFEKWIWWHDDMLLLKSVPDPAVEFQRPLVHHEPRERPNKKLGNWQRWLWDTLGFFSCQSIAAPNPVLHIPRLIERSVLNSIPATWNRQKLLFEPTYLLWNWHRKNITYEIDEHYRIGVFKGEIPDIEKLAVAGHSFLTWGRNIDHASARAAFSRLYPTEFVQP
jgi:hypothetical protein